MSPYPLLRLVATPDITAAVLFDFHGMVGNSGGTSTVQRPDFSIGTPTIEGDPDALGVEYGFRRVVVTARVQGTRAQALAVIAKASRLLLRQRPGYLLFQLDANTKPVWFDLLRPEPTDLSYDNVVGDDLRAPDLWDIKLNLPAQPFALGTRVVMAAKTIQNDPASGGCQVVLDDIKGDAPVPLRIDSNPTATMPAGHRQQWICSPLEVGQPTTPIVWQIGASDGFVAGADTGASVADAAYSGGSYRPVTFATNTTVVNRINGPVSTTIPTGDYMVFVRAARSTTDGKFWLQFGQWIYLGYFYGAQKPFDRLTTGATGHAEWVYLGLFRFPYAVPQAPQGLGVATVVNPDVALAAGRLSGTGDLRLDAIKLVPHWLIDQERPATTIRTFAPAFGMDDRGVWDGETETILSYNTAGGQAPSQFQNMGSFPVGVPGKQNVLTYLGSVDTGRGFFGEDNSLPISGSTSVTVSYRPRLLWVDA